jgi:sarcosine oxidase subunit alpha
MNRQPKEKLVGFIMQEDGVPEDGSAVVSGGILAGRVTSCRFSPGKGKAIGMAWISAQKAGEGEEVTIRVQGRPMRALVTQRAFYDPDGARLRM